MQEEFIFRSLLGLSTTGRNKT